MLGSHLEVNLQQARQTGNLYNFPKHRVKLLIYSMEKMFLDKLNGSEPVKKLLAF